MPHNLDLILTLTAGLTGALAFGLFSQKLRLSPIVGYLVAGVLVGPFTPGYVANSGLAEQLAEVGVILLMFGVGLHFHIEELLAVRKIAIPGALVQSTIATLLGILLAYVVGWGGAAGLVFGLSISVASTVVLLRVLADNDALHTRAGHIAVGWLVVEDVFTVFVLVLLPVLVGGSAATASGMDIAFSVAVAIFKMAGLVAFTFIVGRRFLPWLLTHVAATRSRELFTLTVLVIALGISVGAAQVFGVSMALGAFLAGMVVGQSEFSTRAASDALPMRDAFAVLFFVSMGMLFDPARLTADLWITLATIAVVILAKPASAFLVMKLYKQPVRGALVVSFALGQIGEFSFILAAMGRQLGVLPESATQVMVIASIVSITLNPFLFRSINFLTTKFSRGVKTELEPETTDDDEDDDEAHRVVVVGYGPVGRTLTRLLRDAEMHPVVIELNHRTIQELREDGIEAVYGDATQAQTLENAGIRSAGSILCTSSGMSPEAVIRAARELNPKILVLARASYIREADALRQAGAGAVVAAEAEVALAMSERLLIGLGATPEQLDRARDRVRAELASA